MERPRRVRIGFASIVGIAAWVWAGAEKLMSLTDAAERIVPEWVSTFVPWLAFGIACAWILLEYRGESKAKIRESNDEALREKKRADEAEGDRDDARSVCKTLGATIDLLRSQSSEEPNTDASAVMAICDQLDRLDENCPGHDDLGMAMVAGKFVLDCHKARGFSFNPVLEATIYNATNKDTAVQQGAGWPAKTPEWYSLWAAVAEAERSTGLSRTVKGVRKGVVEGAQILSAYLRRELAGVPISETMTRMLGRGFSSASPSSSPSQSLQPSPPQSSESPPSDPASSAGPSL